MNDQPAAPEQIISRTPAHVRVGVEVAAIVAVKPSEAVFKRTGLVAVPLTVVDDVVMVEAAGNRTVFGPLTVNVPRLDTFADNVIVPPDVFPLKVHALYVKPAPPTTERLLVVVAAKSTVDVFVVNVMFVTVAKFQTVPDVPLTVHVPLPMRNVRVPVPALVALVAIVTLLLLTLKSRMHPVVVPVHALNVRELMLIVAFGVIVQVVPPTQVLASKVTSSALVGAEAPVAPPDDADHIAVLELSHVHGVVQTAKRAAASAPVSASVKKNAARNALIASFICTPR